MSTREEEHRVRLIAFYLPQFHPVPENDQWWGKGFTEWTNVVRAKPLFPGHYQPHLPADLGFYDLRVPETRQAQADLARAYGIYGFCYYHYWFNGRRILHRPFDEVLASGEPDFPFCLCWANENWTRVWDGGSNEVLLKQEHSEQDDYAHIMSLLPAFEDRRYIRIAGRPLVLVYRTELLPHPDRMAEIWRTAARRHGRGELYLVRVESSKAFDPTTIGFDAAVEFAPDWRNMGYAMFRRRRYAPLVRTGLVPRAFTEHFVRSYSSLVRRMLRKPDPGYVRFPGVTPSWDNSPRRARSAFVFHGSTPSRYEQWLRTVVKRTRERLDGEERLVFLNAWNEWAEGNHLEPDQRWGRAYLEATRAAAEADLALPRAEEPHLPAAVAEPASTVRSRT